MGVPKFYRWISERYTKINEIITDSALLPEFDHLYLDMNGIIHGCTHPSHMDISDVISERDMMLGIMHYLDRLITQIVKPRISIYMAIDGVAPRAKLNQQRSRRFRSAKDMAEATKDMQEKDEAGNLKKSTLFDSNCITPGTEFMARVSATIKYFIQKKIKEDPIWRDLKVIFSGQEVPGEGEHKIMEHIRMMKNDPGYQPNTRHCIYGQDADLIMLGLVTHEPHFTILREVVDFSGGFSNKNALKVVKKFSKESDFQLLHLSVLREYLYLEFCKDDPPGTFDLERTVDDFVFMTFLVGNDFLPHLTTLDIGEGAFDFLFQIYKKQRSSWQGQYLTESGNITDPMRLETFLAAVGSAETETLESREQNDAVYIKKKRKWNKRDGLPEGPSDAELKATEVSKQNDYLSMIQNVLRNKNGKDIIDGWEPAQAGERDFKGRYYYEKLKLTPIDVKEHNALRQAYIEGLLWCLAYYYRGCISWSFFYPYHYGPMLSDLRSLPEIFNKIHFDVGTPILPFQQLMSCLPPASALLVPKTYRNLMTSPDSPIIKFYPTDFEVDMNGKKNPWEGVNLLPFIEIHLLLNTIKRYAPDSELTEEEKQRNRVGDILCYSFDPTATNTIEAPHKGIGLTDINKCHSRCTILPQCVTDGVSFRPELVSGTQIPFPGFPSLNVLPIAEAELVAIGVKLFGFPSKYPTMVLKLHKLPDMPPVETLANNLLDKSLFINWPMMHEGKVIAISDENAEIYMYNGKIKTKKWNKTEKDQWMIASNEMASNYVNGINIPGSGGVQIGDVKIRLRLLPLQGMQSNSSSGSTKKLFGKEFAEVPLQLALWQAPAPDPRFIERGPMTLEDRFPVDCNVVLTKGKHRGCIGQVIGIADSKKVGVKVFIFPPEVPFGLALARSINESYVSSTDAARILKINPMLFGRITSSLTFHQGGYDLGLNLKSQEGLCVAGYSRQKRENRSDPRQDKKKAWESGDSLLVIGSIRGNGDADTGGKFLKERIQWEYTPKSIRLVNEYRQKFPALFNALNKLSSEKKYDANAVFGPNWASILPKVREWLNSVESAKLPRTPISTETMTQEAVIAVEKATNLRNLALKKKGFPKESLIKIPGSVLYRENSTRATDVLLASDHNDNEAPQLGDRIVNLCASGIPFGARGIVVGIHKATTGCVEVVLDDEFIGGTSLQGLCSNFRGKLALWAHLMKITVDNNKEITQKHCLQGSSKTKPQIVSNVNGSASKSRASSSGKMRPESSGRAKQAGWREAKAPQPEKGIGFKGVRNGKSGISQWKAFIRRKNATTTARDNDRRKSIELKTMLGVNSSPAILGVHTTFAPQSREESPTASLKAVLGVGGSTIKSDNNIHFQTVNHSSTPESHVNPSAADQLLQLMTKQQQPLMPLPPAILPNGSPFSFSYTKEGEENLEISSQAIPTVSHQYPSGFVGHHGMTPLPMLTPMTAQISYTVKNTPKDNYDQNKMAVVGSPSVTSYKDFPPLGEPPASSSQKKENEHETSNAEVQSFLVPSAVKKTRKK